MSDLLTSLAAGRQRLRPSLGDSLVDAPAFLLHLGEAGGALIDARLRGNYVLQYAMWLAERGSLPALATLLMETPSAGQSWGPVFEPLAGIELPTLRTLVVGRGGGTRKWEVPPLPSTLLAGLEHLVPQHRGFGECLAGVVG